MAYSRYTISYNTRKQAIHIDADIVCTHQNKRTNSCSQCNDTLIAPFPILDRLSELFSFCFRTALFVSETSIVLSCSSFQHPGDHQKISFFLQLCYSTRAIAYICASITILQYHGITPCIQRYIYAIYVILERGKEGKKRSLTWTRPSSLDYYYLSVVVMDAMNMRTSFIGKREKQSGP